MMRGIELCKTGDGVAGMVTTGSTGAALTAGVLKLGKIRGVVRPALALTLPNVKGGKTLLLDCGANVDCAPEYLEQFALMGSGYMRAVHGISDPVVALVSNGAEDKKGNELVRNALPLLKSLPINFSGNMEAKDALSGEYDVLVCDGFVGNVLLKSLEGAFSSLIKMMKASIMSGGLRAKIGGKLIKPTLKKLQRMLGDEENGGAAFLGCSKLLVKAHGNSNATAIKTAIGQLIKMAEGDFIGKLTEEIGDRTNAE
jgi:glycerol-3-phosphate acyltransferase PlsX